MENKFLKVRVRPKAKKDLVIVKKEDCFEIWVKEKAFQNQANQKVLALLASFLKTKTQNLRLIKGFKRPNKIIQWQK